MILTKLGQHVNEMMAVAVNTFQNVQWSRFLIIRQNVNMATNAILNSGLTPRQLRGAGIRYAWGLLEARSIGLLRPNSR